ncbi:MAG: CvpA family protein [Ignavibacteria bacterium]|nr:CvpA family protein [Ignavibacteria bacterium]
MIMDLLILFPIIGFAALGFRDGLVRKLVAIVVAILAMFIAHFLMQDVAKLLIDLSNAQPATAPMTAFFTVFFIIFVLQIVLYRFLAHNYRIGGIVDRIIGSVIGIAQGVLMVSIMFMIFTLQGPPSRRLIWDSRLYRPVVSIAPVIKDYLSNLVASGQESVEQLTAPGETKPDSTAQKPQE